MQTVISVAGMAVKVSGSPENKDYHRKLRAWCDSAKPDDTLRVVNGGEYVIFNAAGEEIASGNMN